MAFGRRTVRRAGAATGGLALLLTGGLAAVVATPATAGTVACSTTWLAPGSSNAWNYGPAWSSGVPTSGVGACLPASSTPYTVYVFGAAAASTLTIGSGATVQLQGESEDGNASLNVGAGGLINGGTVQLTSTTGAHDDTVTVAGGGVFANSGTVSSEPGTGGNRFINGALTNTATLSATVNTVINGGTDTVPVDNTRGVLSVGPSALLYISNLVNYIAATHTLDGGEYDVAGTLDVPGFDVRTLTARVRLLQPGALLKATGAGNALSKLATIDFVGRLTIDSGTLTVAPLLVQGFVPLGAGATLKSTGAVTLHYGTVNVPTGSTLVAPGGVQLQPGGTLVGSGTVQGSVTNSGVIQPNGIPGSKLTVTGNYTQAPGGIYNVNLFSSLGEARTLAVQGTATLNGLLQISVFPTTTGAPPVTLVKAAHRTGTFAVTSFVVLADGTRPVTGYSATAATLTATPVVQDDDARIGYEHWTGDPALGLIGWQRTSSTAGDAMTYAFSGTSVAFDYVSGPDRGIVKLSVDGTSRGTLDTYSVSSSGPNLKTITGLKAGAHKLTVTVAGASNPASTGKAVTIEGFGAPDLFVDLVGRPVSIGGWPTAVSTAASGGSYRSATAAGRLARLSFTGTGVTWITQTCPACGKAQVAIDGGLPTTVDLYSSAVVNKVAKAFGGLTAGPHTITITVLGAKRAAATGTKVVVDAFTVQH